MFAASAARRAGAGSRALRKQPCGLEHALQALLVIVCLQSLTLSTHRIAASHQKNSRPELFGMFLSEVLSVSFLGFSSSLMGSPLLGIATGTRTRVWGRLRCAAWGPKPWCVLDVLYLA